MLLIKGWGDLVPGERGIFFQGKGGNFACPSEDEGPGFSSYSICLRGLLMVDVVSYKKFLVCLFACYIKWVIDGCKKNEAAENKSQTRK